MTRVGNGVLLEPIETDVDAWFAALDAMREKHGDFLPEGRPEQPPVPTDDDIDWDQ